MSTPPLQTTRGKDELNIVTSITTRHYGTFSSMYISFITQYQKSVVIKII
jgi:hypothetical protein